MNRKIYRIFLYNPSALTRDPELILSMQLHSWLCHGPDLSDILYETGFITKEEYIIQKITDSVNQCNIKHKHKNNFELKFADRSHMGKIYAYVKPKDIIIKNINDIIKKHD